MTSHRSFLFWSSQFVAVGAVALTPALAQADLANLPAPPQGFDQRNNGIPHGELELSLTYPTRNRGSQKVTVYRPPGYSTATRYPVL
ncbi:MAG TPA: hypothetical protein VFZ53_10470, partial [Polyangiaceae bacterium]